MLLDLLRPSSAEHLQRWTHRLIFLRCQYGGSCVVYAADNIYRLEAAQSRACMLPMYKPTARDKVIFLSALADLGEMLS